MKIIEPILDKTTKAKTKNISLSPSISLGEDTHKKNIQWESALHKQANNNKTPSVTE